MELPQIVPVLQVMEYPEFQRSTQMVVSENRDIYIIYIYTQMDTWPFQQGRWMNMLTNHRRDSLFSDNPKWIDLSIHPCDLTRTW